MRTQYDLLDFFWHVIFQRQLQPTIATTINILATPRSRTTVRTHNVETRQCMNGNRRQNNSSIRKHPSIATKPVVGTLMSSIMTMTALCTNVIRHHLSSSLKPTHHTITRGFPNKHRSGLSNHLYGNVPHCTTTTSLQQLKRWALHQSPLSCRRCGSVTVKDRQLSTMTQRRIRNNDTQQHLHCPYTNPDNPLRSRTHCHRHMGHSTNRPCRADVADP
jgi:hypothetical protein